MAEEGSVYELEGLENQLQSLLSRYSSDELRADSKAFCSDFCKLVEEYASRWQVPLPQLRILEIALIYFTRVSTFFTSNCDHVLHTLSSLALSVFELLLFFDQKDFHQEPLKHFTASFQECYLALERHQNVHLPQVARLVEAGGPWASLVLQAILSESILPQNEVDGCIGSEPPVFFELRVRYLLSSERVSEAMALAKCCAQHPTTGQHLFFLQVYLTWLHKTSQHDRLHKEVDDLNGKEAVHIICSLECEEEDDLLLALARAFLSQQLHRGDVYYLWDLVFTWSKLHSRLNTSKQTLLEESRQLMLSATNVNSIFPFIRAILQELGEDGIQFCVELCASALESCLPCDVVTKSLIYKTIAGLLPNDLEICRACALLVFFLERTFEAYKMVYLLYMHPDQEYHADYSPIGNHVRFETLQVLKKDLYFDPEFWNLIALRTNCLKLMNEKVVSAALEEIMEDKWIPNYCTKEPAFQSRTLACQKGSKGALHPAAKKRHHKEDTDTASKRLKVGSGKTQLNAVKKKGKKGSRTLNETSSKPLRRSFWQLDRIPENVAIAYGEHRRTTRLSEKNPPKRRIRRPKWLLEDSGTLEENNVLPKFKNNGLKHQKHHRSSIVKRAESGQIKNNIKYKPSVNSHLKARENNNHQKGFSLDCVKPATPPQVILELSLPDNELMGTFTEDTCNRQRGFPQVLLYKPTVKLPATSQPVKTVHGKEVVLRARDETMFVLQLHCYARQQKGKGKGLNVQGSVSTITRSSVQGSPPKEPPREFCEEPDAEMKGGIVSQTPVAPDVAESRDLEKVLQGQTTKAGSRKTSSAREHSEKVDAKMRTTTASQTSAAAEVTEDSMLQKVPQAQTTASVGELCEEPAVEMKVTIASQTPTVVKVTQTPNLDKVSKVPAVEDISKITASPKVVWTTTADDNQVEITDKITLVSNIANMSNIGPSHPVPSQSQDTALRDGDQELKSFSCNSIAKADVLVGSPKDSSGHVLCENDTCLGGSVVTLTKTLETQAIDQDSINDISALTLVTEMVTELAPKELAQELENDKPQTPVSSSFKESKAGSKPKVPHKTSSITNWPVPEQEASTVADVQGKKGKGRTLDNALEIPEDSEPMETTPESEESKLEYCCTFCSKVFKGSRVVAHAMFHYRRDECMFCGTVFKDDLLAMMHLSDHIEKLKKSKDLVGNKAQQNQVCETKDISTPKTSAKAKDINVSSGHRSSGRLKKSPVCSKSVSLPDSSASESRKLRSNDKPVDGQLLQEKKQNTLKHLNGETPVHKVNGHIDKKREIRHVSKEQELDKAKKNLQAKQPLTQQKIPQQRASNGYKNPELPENHDMAVDFSTSSAQVEKDFGCSSENKMRETESLQVLKTATKQNEKNVEPQEKLCCPVDGCAWFTDVSKKRVALLYHALEDHCGEVKPLELAFRVGNSKCSICMRVLWSFEHFLHHVERHRLSPRHPCLHQGCTARFKTGMEMRRHARRHSPLQAVCCHPGCSQLFICLWALNLHEREHYASKSAKPDKNLNMQTGDKQLKTETGEKQQDKSNDATAVHKAVSVKVAHNRQQATHNSSSRNHKAPITTVRTTLLKQELMERNETKESNILKNLSDKDASAQPTVPNLRLRQTLKVTNATTSAPKSKVISLLLKHKSKLRYKFKKKQVKVNAKCPKRRGRPPKSNKAVQGENTAGQKNETIKTAVQKDQKSPAQLSSSLKAAETSNLSNKLKEDERKHVVKATETSTDVSKSQKLKKLSKLKKRSTCQTASDSSKSKNSKATISKTNTNKVKKKGPVKEPKSALKKPIQSESVGEAKATDAIVKTSDEVGKAQVENTNSTQSNPENLVPAVTADSLNEKTAPPTTSGETTQKLTTEEKSKKSHIAKKEVKKERNTPSACSGKATKNYKDGNKEGDKSTVVEKQPCKDRCNKSVTKKTMANSEVQQQVEATATLEKTLDEVGKGKVEASDATLDNTDPSMTAVTNSVNEKTAATADHTQKITEKKSKKSGAMKNSANQKRKNIHKESDTKRVKKKSLDLSLSEESKTLPQTLQSTISGPGYSLVMNGQEVNEDLKSTVCTGILAKYSKRPYMRLPPTAYLAEKYITMPKRRKDISFFPCSQKSPPPEQTTVTTALQRQRCANCFATFNSSEELQSHLQAQKCSDLFGFDSDEEGKS